MASNHRDFDSKVATRHHLSQTRVSVIRRFPMTVVVGRAYDRKPGHGMSFHHPGPLHTHGPPPRPPRNSIYFTIWHQTIETETRRLQSSNTSPLKLDVSDCNTPLPQWHQTTKTETRKEVQHQTTETATRLI